MKSWFHNHRIRKQRSESQLLPNPCSPIEVEEIVPARVLSARPTKMDNAARIAASKTASRMSIERYLSAPLEDEPASLPAIKAALQRQSSQRSLRSRVPSRTGHSRDTSYDANSDGRRTFYTSGSAPDSSKTSHSAVSRADRLGSPQQRTKAPPSVPDLPKREVLNFDNSRVASPERPMTSGTVDMEKTWAEQMEKFMPGFVPEPTVDYQAKAKEEIARIQEKAKLLEDRMQRFRAERDIPEPLRPRITDEEAHARMAAHPKLAWVLGGDVSDSQSIARPKSSGSAMTRMSDIPERPSSSGTLGDTVPSLQDRTPRRSKSSGALDERARRATLEKRQAGIFERKPSRRPRFYCTFCQKRFHSRLEWQRHEQTIHMPEELWVCCPRTGEFPDRCPFCSKSNPSPSHLADHNYLSCQEKPLSERTFSRQDHFLQHISQVHKVSPGQKPLRLTELLEAWRHPLPLRSGHQALHCGFCGKTFNTYKERTEHVGRHFAEGMDMMSWWTGRVSHDIPHPKPSEVMHRDPDIPHRCSYCERTYENLAVAQKLHPVCSMWSCSFLPGMQYTIYPSGSRADLEAVCCYCNDTLVRGAGKVKGSVLKEHINQHNFRNCNQRLYFSGQRFRQHLQDNHKTNFDGTLFAGWTLLLKSSKREKPSIFEPLGDTIVVKRAYTDPGSTKSKPLKRQEEPQVPKLNFMDLSETPQRATRPKTKLRRKASTQTMPEKKPDREVRESTQFFTRAATIELAYGANASPSPRLAGLLSPRLQPSGHKPGFPVHSLPIDAVNTAPKFYRRRLDASTRNRLYVRDQDDGPLSKNSQRLFRKVPGSVFGGLVLHSSLVGATPAKMTNSVDIYSLH